MDGEETRFDLQGDLFGPSVTTSWWKDYLTGGDKGPGGKKYVEAQALRNRFMSSEEAGEMGWTGRRDKLLYKYKNAEERETARRVSDMERGKRYAGFKVRW